MTVPLYGARVFRDDKGDIIDRPSRRFREQVTDNTLAELVCALVSFGLLQKLSQAVRR
jgi:ABC-type transporter lipoprotein component MlaA